MVYFKHLILIVIAGWSPALLAQSLALPDFNPVAIQSAVAEEIARYPAVEAGQGAAADADHFYAIVNTAIGKYRKHGGELVSRWASPRNGHIRHLNSCYAEGSLLYCSNSNFPEIPMASSIEVFDTRTMDHVQSYSLGILEEGSLTWFERLGEGWIAGFAHYDENGGLHYKDHSFASVVRFDSQWRRVGGWMIPASAIARMQPYAASGGTIGSDGLLYLTGHDRPEMYVMGVPTMGPKLEHIATISINVEGQAFAWDKSNGNREVYGISRPNREVRAFRLPVITIPEGVSALTEVNFGL